MRELDGMRIMGRNDGELTKGRSSTQRALVSASETGERWSLGEIAAEPDDRVATHVHPGEPEAFIILEGVVELHGAEGITELAAGDVVFIPPDVEHGLRAPSGGRWIAVWPTREREPGTRYGS